MWSQGSRLVAEATAKVEVDGRQRARSAGREPLEGHWRAVEEVGMALRTFRSLPTPRRVECRLITKILCICGANPATLPPHSFLTNTIPMSVVEPALDIGFICGCQPWAQEGMAFLAKAAGQGHAYAMQRLAGIYYDRKEYEQAVAWFTKGAEAGLPEAMFSLGRCLDTGEGVAVPDYPAVGSYTRPYPRLTSSTFWAIRRSSSSQALSGRYAGHLTVSVPKTAQAELISGRV